MLSYPSIHPPTHPVRGIIVLALPTGVIGVFVSLDARPPVVLLDVALPAFTAVAAQGVDTDVCAQCLVAGGTLIDICCEPNADSTQFPRTHFRQHRRCEA